MSVYVSKQTAWENLCNAIIEQAVRDYRKALADKDFYKILTLERFFQSDWYRQLTKVNGDYIISEIRKEMNFLD